MTINFANDLFKVQNYLNRSQQKDTIHTKFKNGIAAMEKYSKYLFLDMRIRLRTLSIFGRAIDHFMFQRSLEVILSFVCFIDANVITIIFYSFRLEK